MKNSLIVLICLSFLISACSSSGDALGGWQLLGEQSVNLVIDHDEFMLGNANDQFSKIRIKAIDGPIHFQNMRVHFDNGSVQNIPIKTVLRQGEVSRAIRLDGGRRNLKKITFWYNTVGFLNGKSKVAVYGS